MIKVPDQIFTLDDITVSYYKDSKCLWVRIGGMNLQIIENSDYINITQLINDGDEAYEADVEVNIKKRGM